MTQQNELSRIECKMECNKMNRNITYLLRRDAKEELKFSGERYKKILDNIDVGIAVINTRMKFVFVNNTMKQWFPNLDFTSKASCFKVFKSVRQEQVCDDCPVQKAFDTGQTHQTIHRVKLNEDIKYYRIIASPIVNLQGKVDSVIETSVDITEKKLAELKIKRLNQELESLVNIQEASLRESEQKYRSLLKHSSEGIFIFCPEELKILEANTSFMNLLGYSDEQEMVGLKLEDFYVGQSNIKYNLSNIVDKGETVHGVRTYRRKDGQLVEVEVSISLISYSNQKVCLANVHDITEVKKSALALEESNRKLAEALKETVNALVTVGEKRDPYTAGHQHRVAVLSQAIGQELGLPENQVEALFIAGTLHDIGKIHIPSDILNKPGRLTNIEFDLIKTHPEIGHDIINRIPFELPIAEIVIQHHERLDGTGYPKGLKGEEICLEAKILAVADVVEAMASHRPYRPAIGLDKALLEISEHSGSWYDPQVVEACIKLVKDKGFSFN